MERNFAPLKKFPCSWQTWQSKGFFCDLCAKCFWLGCDNAICPEVFNDVFFFADCHLFTSQFSGDFQEFVGFGNLESFESLSMIWLVGMSSWWIIWIWLVISKHRAWDFRLSFLFLELRSIWREHWAYSLSDWYSIFASLRRLQRPARPVRISKIPKI